MKQRLLHTPEGVRDIYNDECAKKLALEDRLHTVFKTYGYNDIETPTFEFFDVFSREVGTIASKELYKFFDREGNTLVLRPDFTPSVARAAAKYFMGEDMPIRLCYKGNTFINHSSYQGRLKESTQMGAELIGDNRACADAEMIALIIDLLLKAGLKEFQVSVGQVDFFKSLLEEAGIDEETEADLRTMISHKHNFGVEDLLEGKEITKELKNAFLKLPQLFGSVDILEKAKSLTTNTRALESISRLERIHEILCFYGLEKYISFDLGMLSKYKYYTGIIFRAYTYGTGDAVIKGGRYDSLLERFGKKAPSIGFAVEVDQLMNALGRQKINISYDKNNTLVLYNKPEEKFAIELTNHFRKSGMCIELISIEADKSIDEYKNFAKRSSMGGILYLEGKEMVQVINLKTDEVQTVDIETLLGNQ